MVHRLHFGTLIQTRWKNGKLLSRGVTYVVEQSLWWGSEFSLRVFVILGDYLICHQCAQVRKTEVIFVVVVTS